MSIRLKARHRTRANAGTWIGRTPLNIALQETAGLLREGEPVHLALGFFADDIKKPEREIRVVTYDPTSPKADTNGYVVAPSQIKSVTGVALTNAC